MKRRIILFLCFIISVNFIFARDMLVEIKEALQETGLYVFSKEDAKKEQKPFVDISYMPKEKFVKMYTTPWIRKDIFSDSNNITYEDIIKFFKNGVKIDSLPGWTYENYSWRKGNNIEYSVVYSLSTYYPITGPGHYSIKIFDSDYVYIIGLDENKVIDEPDNEYDKLNDIFEYREGRKEDAKKGIEQSQGYYCSEESAARFYTKLRKKDYDLPKAALRFQEAEEFIEKVLDMY